MTKSALFLMIFIFIQAINVSAQNCVYYIPSKQDAKWEIKHFDGRGKLTHIVKNKLKEITTTDSSSKMLIESESFDFRGKWIGKNSFAAGCEHGTFYVNMRSNIDHNGMNNLKNMKVKINADDLNFPTSSQLGQALNSGKFTIDAQMQGMPGEFKMSVNVYNRKVEGNETVTTAAGTFDCVKISYSMKTIMMVEIKAKGVEWYAKDVGLVKSESYDLKGKLLNYSLLSVIK